MRFKDPRRAPIRSPDDTRINLLLEIADMADTMKSSGKRYKKLTKDTATALAHTCSTCRGIVDLVKHLLSTIHDYVLLGIFTTDFLEKMFSKLRDGSGGTYFITVQQVSEKLYIHKTKLLLNLNVNVASFNVLSGHLSECCQFLMGDHTIDVFDNLPKLEISLPTDVKETLVYIAGYIIHKEMPVDGRFNIIFHEIMNNVCQNSLRNVLMVISDVYSLNMDIFCQIFS